MVRIAKFFYICLKQYLFLHYVTNRVLVENIKVSIITSRGKNIFDWLARERIKFFPGSLSAYLKYIDIIKI